MGALTGLVLGAGLFTLWWACWAPAPSEEGVGAAAARSPRARLLDLLASAGLSGLP